MTQGFRDRREAGTQLAEQLLPYGKEHPLVLGLPRGGVPVAYEVAFTLDAPLDTLVARKIGAPGNSEFAVGAIAPGDVIILNNASIESLGLTEKDLDPIIAREMQEMDRRMEHYQSGTYSTERRGDTVIIVDDGLATGMTARAAIESVKITLKPKRIIFVAPICARDAADMIRGLVDELVCLREVDNLIAIGRWYQDFPQVTDDEVVSYLEAANG